MDLAPVDPNPNRPVQTPGPQLLRVPSDRLDPELRYRDRLVEPGRWPLWSFSRDGVGIDWDAGGSNQIRVTVTTPVWPPRTRSRRPASPAPDDRAQPPPSSAHHRSARRPSKETR